MKFSDFEIPEGKIATSAQKVLSLAFEDSRQRKCQMTNELIFLAFAKSEWDFFTTLMYDLNLNPHEILNTIDSYLKKYRKPISGISLESKLVCKLALHYSARTGRQTIESADLIMAIFDQSNSIVADIFREKGIYGDQIIGLIRRKLEEDELVQERLKKRFELPPNLNYFGSNLNSLARKGHLAQVFDRDKEINKILEVLCHRQRANSVMLIGEPGVGKTAVVEGLATMIEFDPEKIPIRLRDCQIVSLAMNALVAGTMLRGMFEDRILNVIKELKERPNLILFVDEAQTLIGAGSALGNPSDAATIFKSVLARGEVRMIAATTSAEYKQHIAEDEALARRFRTVFIEEPTIEQTRKILMKSKAQMERKYSVTIDEQAIETAIIMTPRYERHLHLPDKVIGWLDTACVRAEIDKSLMVTADKVISVIADNSKLPETMVARKSVLKFEEMKSKLSQRVIGQSEAVRAVANRLVLNKSFLKENFNRPDGVLLFLGPTGVGKTELAKTLAELLFGDENKMIRIDMSEYQAEYSGSAGVDKLIGMPRGIVGSERGGILTNQLRDNPYSVVLLDEIEKAGFSLRNLFLQAFDEGFVTDGRGRRVYLSDTIIIMTSNLGSEHFRKLTNPLGFADQKNLDTNQISKEVLKDMEKRFSPEFINRIDETVVFSPLTEDEVRQIANKYIDNIRTVLVNERKILTIDQNALDQLIIEGHSLAYGARFLKRVIDTKIKIPISIKLDKSMNFHVVLRDGKIEVENNGISHLISNPEFQTI